MSWNVSYASLTNFKADIREPGAQCDDTNETVRDQLGMARLCAQQLVDSGCVGENDDEVFEQLDYKISLYGHANPGHKPASGWANDCVSVSVTQL